MKTDEEMIKSLFERRGNRGDVPDIGSEKHSFGHRCFKK